MTLIKHLKLYALVICIAALPPVIMAQDGYNHIENDGCGYCNQRNEIRFQNSNSNYSRGFQIQTRQNYDHLNYHNGHPAGCTDCQNYKRLNNRHQSEPYQNNISLQPVQNISAFQIEKEAHLLMTELRSASQFDSYPKELHEDINRILNLSKKLTLAEENGETDEQLFQIAKMISSPMKRIDQYFSFQKQDNRVQSANQDMMRMLIAYAKPLRRSMRNQPLQNPRTYPSDQSPVLNPANEVIKIPVEMKGIAQMSKSDQAAALQQKICPVTEEPLGSMGKPIRVNVASGSIFVCCQGCVKAVKKNPEKYLSVLQNSH